MLDSLRYIWLSIYRNKNLETNMVSWVGISGRLGSRKAFGSENKPPFFKATAKETEINQLSS